MTIFHASWQEEGYDEIFVKVHLVIDDNEENPPYQEDCTCF